MEEAERITRQSASNLALAFVLLPQEKRAGMSALYAFCRQVDDVADEDDVPVAVRRERLAAWRDDVHRACENGTPTMPVNRELQPVIQKCKLPFELFNELLLGVEADLDRHRYSDYEELDLYCYRVASVVGLLSIEIFGYSDPECRSYAVHLGRALQYTNILRDVGSDALRGRIYLPQTELKRFGVTDQEILGGTYSERFLELARSVAERARGFYRKAAAALPAADRRSMIAAELMGSVYWKLLCRLEAMQFRVLNPKPVKLSKANKLLLIGRTWARLAAGSRTPNYGK